MAHSDAESVRRRQLIETTIDTMAELGFVATTLAQIGQRAKVSTGLVAHYFGDKDGLLDATLRELAARLSRAAASRLRHTQSPRERALAVIDSALAVEQFDQRTARVWLAFWGQAVHSPQLRRVQLAYQRRLLSNLLHPLKRLLPAYQARRVALGVAALIDGIWLNAVLSTDGEVDSQMVRGLVVSFMDGQLSASNSEHAAKGLPPAPSSHGHTPRQDQTSLTSINPANGRVVATFKVADAAEVERAVILAQNGQRRWAALNGARRGAVLRRVATLLRERNDELARLETLDTGKPIQETSVVDVQSAADCLDYFGGLAAGIAGEHIDFGEEAFGYTRREPLGVVAGLGAWNYPLQIACWKAAPALAAGNAMIFKPAELTPMTASRLVDIMLEAGVPEGVFQVVQGFAATGRLLTRHPLIRKVSLTGAAATGHAVMHDAADTLKAVTLELGGKSPIVIFEDADLDEAVSGAMLGNFYSAGEVCSNGTRVFVQRRVMKDFLDRLKRRVERMVLGDPLDPATQVGSLIGTAHMAKVLDYIAIGKSEGATLLTGGNRVTRDGLDQGCFVEPTIFIDCHDQMRIVREEIFGPVMSVLVFDDEHEVIARANDTEYGLAAGVFTRDLARAHRVIARLQAGTCWVNHYNITPIELPFGGVKGSGLGRENGRTGMDYYSQLKSVYVAMTGIDAPY